MKAERPAAEFARLKHPTEHGLYYDNVTGGWVRQGWTVWTMDSWRPLFGEGFNDATGVDAQGRHWEFFGYRIPLIRAE